MKLQIKLSILLTLLTSPLLAFEVNTHQAITRCATTIECGTEGVENLEAFVEHAQLTTESYETAVFEGYGDSYFHYAKVGKGFTDWSISFKNYTYLGLVEAGVVLEDSVYHNEDTIAQGGDGRFNNHFYSAQFHSPKGPLMKTDRTLSTGYGQRTDNINWVLNDNVALGAGRTNAYTLQDAFAYYRKSFTGTAQEMHKNQANLFVSLGFMIHMLQDLHSPAHVRDGSHPLGDYLEIYGRYPGGFRLVWGNWWESPKNSAVLSAIQHYDMKKVMLVDNHYSSYQDFFTHEANWVSNNFFSEAHNDSTGNSSEIDSLDFDTVTDTDTIFDANNPLPAESDTIETAIPNAEPTGRWHYIETLGNLAVEQGTITHPTLAIIEKGHLFDSERMMAVVNGANTNTAAYQNYDKTPLSDTAINVMPRAVASSQAFINFFFRGKMEAVLNTNNESITLKNISDQTLVSSSDLLTFKSGNNNLKVLYIDENGESKILMSVDLTQDLAVNDEFEILGVAEKLNDPNIILGEDKKIIVLFDGQIGEDKGLDDYQIDAQGLSVAFASTRVTDADILFSFDTSGSMGSSIENAKSSATQILNDIIGEDNDSVSIEVEAFSSDATVLLAYENNVSKAKAVISGIFSGGGTALYDAIQLAGHNAVAHKLDKQTQKSIVILYTDGLENSSSATKAQAIAAISNAKAPEIDDVFLIFVGNDASGVADLQDIANQAGRKFMNVSNASGLKDAIKKILIGQ